MTYTDCSVVNVKNAVGNMTTALRTVAGTFHPEQVGIRCKVGVAEYKFSLNEFVDDKTMIFGGYVSDTNAPAPVAAFNVPGVLPVFTDVGSGSDVGWMLIKPFSKGFACGDAKVGVR